MHAPRPPLHTVLYSPRGFPVMASTKPMADGQAARASVLALAAAVTIPTILGTAPSYLAARAAGQPLALWLTIVWQASTWVFWAAAALPVLALHRRFPLPGGRTVHAVAALALTAVHATLLTFTVPLLFIHLGDTRMRDLFTRAAGIYLPLDLLTYGAILLAALGVGSYRERIEREKQLAEARLDALSMQMQPHFLFNSLNTAAVLVRRRDHDAALRVLTSLGVLLRSVLDTDTHERPLAQELAFLASYLSIQELRFSDRLVVSIDADEEARRAQVPTLILQPVVENAIVHGIAHRDEPGGCVTIRAIRERSTLRMEVRDNGPGLPDGFTETSGKIGLRNTRARLQQVYGAGARMDVTPAPDGGTLVTIVIPYRAGIETRVG
jgi:two-component system LytT family sensor kinase